MLPLVILPYVINFAGLVYLIPAMLLTLYYNYIGYDLLRFKKNKFDIKQAKKEVGYSSIY